MSLLIDGFPSPPKADELNVLRPPKVSGLLRDSTQQEVRGFRFLSSNADLL